MYPRKAAGILILLFLLWMGYIQDIYVINIKNSDYPLLLERSLVYELGDKLHNDPRWLSSLIYFFLYAVGGSYLVELWTHRTWSKYAFFSYLFLSTLTIFLAVMYKMSNVSFLLAIARTIKAFYLSVTLPLIFIFIYWYRSQID